MAKLWVSSLSLRVCIYGNAETGVFFLSDGGSVLSQVVKSIKPICRRSALAQLWETGQIRNIDDSDWWNHPPLCYAIFKQGIRSAKTTTGMGPAELSSAFYTLKTSLPFSFNLIQWSNLSDWPTFNHRTVSSIIRSCPWHCTVWSFQQFLGYPFLSQACYQIGHLPAIFLRLGSPEIQRKAL